MTWLVSFVLIHPWFKWLLRLSSRFPYKGHNMLHVHNSSSATRNISQFTKAKGFFEKRFSTLSPLTVFVFSCFTAFKTCLRFDVGWKMQDVFLLGPTLFNALAAFFFIDFYSTCTYIYCITNRNFLSVSFSLSVWLSRCFWVGKKEWMIISYCTRYAIWQEQI